MNAKTKKPQPEEEPAPPPASSETPTQPETETEEKAVAEKAHKKPILVPVDFSPHSEAALAHAGYLGDSMGAPLLVLHVVHDPGDMPGYYVKALKKKRLSKIEDIAAEMLEEFLTRVKKGHPGLESLKNADTKQVIGLPSTRILEIVDKVHPRMVVMGSKGRTGLKHVLLGSIAERVAQMCPVPVTIVKVKKK